MKILFIYPNKVMVTRMPLGIGYIAAYLKKDGHEVRVFDTTFIKCGESKNDEQLREASLQVRNPDLGQYGLVERRGDPYSELEGAVRAFKPDLVGLSVVDPNYNFGLGLLRKVKENHKDLLTVVGGSTATFAPEEVIAEDCVDIVCIGEGEMAMAQLCGRLSRSEDIRDTKNMLIKEGGKVYRNDVMPLLDPNRTLPPDWDIFDKRHLIRPLGGQMHRMGVFMAARGCLFHCKYCANSDLLPLYKGKGQYYRAKSAELLVGEIEAYKNKYDLNFVFFTDDLFPLHNGEFIERFCGLYKEKVGLPFNISLHPALVKEDAFAKVVDAGCRNICVGLESGSARIRKDVLGRSYTDDQIIDVFRLARKYNIRSSSFNMIGLPYETREDIFSTIRLNRKARPTTATLTFFHPYRGTELRDLCVKERFFDPSREREYENLYREESCLKLPSISSGELKGIFSTFQLYFKLPGIFYPFIKIAEKPSRLGRAFFGVLKRIFYLITAGEAKFDFSAGKTVNGGGKS